MTTTQSGKTTRKTSAVKTRMADSAPETATPTIQRAEPPKSAIPQEDWRALVAKAAYYRAQARGFEAGSPDQDWFAAEEELKQRLGRQ